ncbi:MAG: sensory protein TspO [Isosphaeraceae bacterium]|jgi:tryptophan-rich sensory protein|nr:MAG: sensory protein TspO [Isosphaeraceae bacterium]
MHPAATWVGLLGWLIVTYAVAAYGALSTSDGVRTWYPSLAKPSWTPPNWLFGPVWSLLYLSMALAAWLIWCEAGRRDVRRPLALYLGQLTLNASWSMVFFGWRQPGPAFGVILLLLAAILLTAVAFHRVRPLAGWLLAPYIAWVGFASALNGAIWWLNR